MNKKQRKHHMKRLRNRQKHWHEYGIFKSPFCSAPPFDDDLDDFDDWHQPETCPECGGSGEIIDCLDDMCHGQGFCVHGDVRICMECHGEGEV